MTTSSAPLLLAALLLGTDPASDAARPPAPSVVTVPDDALRESLRLSPHYAKSVVRDGFAVLGSAKVSDVALLEAADLVDRVLAGRADLRAALVRRKVRLAVMAPTEFTTDIPEHADLTPAEYWDKRARGLGASDARPAVSCGEENLLGHPGDPYEGENILIHEFAHAVHEMALRDVDPTFDARLREAYQAAMRDGLWKGTYSTTNRAEYWAEGVQSWFDANRDEVGGHNDVATRERLRDYDPRLAALLAEVFRGNDWRYVPPASRKETGHLAGYDPAAAPRFEWPEELLEWYREHGQEAEKRLTRREKVESGP